MLRPSIIFLLAILFGTSTLLAQVPSAGPRFPTEKDKFLKELESFVREVSRDDCNQAVKTFTEQVNSGAVTPEQLTIVTEICNKMAERSLRAYPYYFNFLNSIINFNNYVKNPSLFTTWVSITKSILVEQKKGDNKKFDAWLDFSDNLFKERALFKNAAKTWVIGTPNYTLSYENGSPKLSVPPTQLYAYTLGDTFFINGTSGTYYPLDHKWIGKNGKVNWQRADMDTNVVYARLYDYEADMSKQEFEAKNIDFYFTLFFTTPIKGNYKDKLIFNNAEERSTYPRFNSSDQKVKINSLAENVSYIGPFNLWGQKIYSHSDSGMAQLVFYLPDGKTVAMRARATDITIRKPVELSAKNAAVSVYFGSDSIYHPGLNIDFKIPTRELRIFRGKQGTEASKFFDSYHNVSIEADALRWDLDKDYITFSNLEGAGEKPGVFKSDKFFNQVEMARIRTIADYEPLARLKMHFDKTQNKVLTGDEFAKIMNPNLTELQCKPLLYKMVEEGFIYYDPNASRIELLDKIFFYVNANAKKSDYDILKFESFSKEFVGRINLKNYDVEMKGVRVIPLSDSTYTYVFPTNKEIRLKKNRDFEFGGTILTGRYDLFGSNFYFHYEPFMIELGQVDSAIINLPDGENLDEFGQPLYYPLRTRLEKLKGKLEIDFPINKSGKSPLKQFPKLSISENSYAYYDQAGIFNSVYKRDKFFFKLDPFKKDSLLRFAPHLLFFDGTMVSAGIFPDFKEKLKIQADSTLGFKSTTPTEGFANYGGKGKYTGTITLNWKGFRGNGKLEYLTAKLKAEDIIFFPDSMRTIAQDFSISKATTPVNTPSVQGKNTPIHWRPYQDAMDIKRGDTSFAMYENYTQFNGDLKLTTKELSGNGSLEWAEATLSSQLFHFRSEDLNADTASLKIKSLDGNKVTFSTPNVNAKIDFKTRYGKFATNAEDIPIDFANNQYRTTINKFDWDMNKKILDFKSPEGSEGAYFVSTHPNQNNLKFLAKRAIFSLDSSIIRASSVPEIRVADARVIPADGKVVIEPQAVMKTLTNAKIKGDTVSAYQQFINVTTNIYGLRSMIGKGDYIYKTKDARELTIKMDSIYVVHNSQGEKKDLVESWNVLGTGQILEEQKFEVYPKVSFKGRANVLMKNPLVNFTGYLRIGFAHPKVQTNWFSVKHDIQPINFVLPLAEMHDEDGNESFAGIAFSKSDSSAFYTSVMSSKRSKTDVEVFKADGIIYHNPTTGIWQFGDSNKIFHDARQGNIMKYDDVKGMVSAEGLLKMGLSLGAIQSLCAGSVVSNLNDGTYNFEVMLALNMELDKTVNEVLAKNMSDEFLDAPEGDLVGDKFQRNMSNMMQDEKKQAKMWEEFQKTNLFVMPKEIFHNVVFGNIKFKYDPIEQTLRSVGPINILSVGEKVINRDVKGYFEIGFRRSGDYINIYLESSAKEWFFITYKSSSLKILSSFDEVNKSITALDADKRTIKREDGKFYTYFLETQARMKAYVERMKGYGDK